MQRYIHFMGKEHGDEGVLSREHGVSGPKLGSER